VTDTHARKTFRLENVAELWLKLAQYRQKRANSEGKNFRDLAAGKGVLDSESAILFFKAAGFNRSPTPSFLVITGNST